MMHYRDRTFCKAKCKSTTCNVKATKEIEKAAESFGLPLSVADYSGDCEKYEPREKEEVRT